MGENALGYENRKIFQIKLVYTNICIYICIIQKQKNEIIMKVFATLSNGNQSQIELIGDEKEILNFIENYNGNDLGNDIVCENFVTDFNETGVIIYK